MELKTNLNGKSVRKGKLQPMFKEYQEETFLFLVILIILAISPIFSPEFFSTYNLFNLLRQISYTAIISVGMLLVILIGGIDLSVGSMMQAVGLSSILLLQNQVPVWLVVLIGLLFGLFLGLINGVLITFGRLQPFIVTLGTMVIIEGVTLVITKGKGVSGDVSDSFLMIGAGYLGPIPVPVIIMVLIYLAGYFALTKTVFGRHIYALGSNRVSAFNSGINVSKIQILIYSFSGLFAAVAGLLVASRTGAFQPGGATGMELNAIAAVVVGGASLAGGKGTIGGTFLGALLAGLLFNLLVFLNMNTYIQQFILGIIILAAVIISAFRR
ncbi:ABC transporter permease [Bacillus sp. V59.32b]|uniref:ABC transporter permease n=1 Tax=Bacillus sp. V59.32b TaxID=1758642 RepID=UPI000E3DBA48|nr:ribose ABC transporter permease [Bacillus sp. V59.32b]RFU61000.1 ribose ABC transporter permease [Bacillus sp. V59.32b]